MSEKTTFKVKYIPTGFIYELPKERCDYLVLNEPFNFEVVDKGYKNPIEPKEDNTSVYNKVIADENEPTLREKYELMSVKKLVAYAKEKEYDLKKATKKDDIIARILEIEGE